MRIIRTLEDCTPPLERGVLTIGNFDGVHLGHREMFRCVVRRAREVNGQAAVLTFVPHPLKVLTPERAPRLLNTYEEKERLIAASCIDVLAALPFDQTMAEMPPERFVKDILVRRFDLCHLVVGYDYAFGRNREGDVEFLRAAGHQSGFEVEMLQPVRGQDVVFSSTLIRRRLAAGDVAGAVELLGRHYTLEGRVIHGASRGTSLGFPTANLRTEKEVLPRPGVYAVKARLADRILDGVMNIGFNPTFGTERISLEVHLLDFSADIYDQTLRVYFVDRLREEMVFASVEGLVEQIHKDIQRARQILDGQEIIAYRDYLDCGLEEQL